MTPISMGNFKPQLFESAENPNVCFVFCSHKTKKTTEISQFQHDPGLHLSNSKRESESAYPAYPAYAVSSLIRFPSICLHLCPGVALSTSSCIKTLNLLTSSIYLDLSTSTTLSIYLCIYPSIHSFIYLTISGSFYPSIRYFSIWLSLSLCLYPSIFSMYLSIFLFHYDYYQYQ